MPLQLALFPESFIALQQEVIQHPALMRKLEDANVTATNLPEFLAAVATYCNVFVQGYMGEAELDKLCHTLTEKLRDKGTIFIL